jgi:hypothetical protein
MLAEADPTESFLPYALANTFGRYPVGIPGSLFGFPFPAILLLAEY